MGPPITLIFFFLMIMVSGASRGSDYRQWPSTGAYPGSPPRHPGGPVITHVNLTSGHTLAGFSVLGPKVPQYNHLPAVFEPMIFQVEFNHWTTNTWLMYVCNLSYIYFNTDSFTHLNRCSYQTTMMLLILSSSSNNGVENHQIKLISLLVLHC